MLITVVNGSPRSAGATGKALQAAAAFLAGQPGVEIRYLELGRQAFEFCRGCQACYRTGRCAITDDGLEQAADAVKASDAVILGSPTYGGNLSSQLKNFLDRGHFIMERALEGKYGFSVSTYEIADGRQVNRLLEKFFLVSGAKRCGGLCFQIGFNCDPLAEPRNRRRLEKALERFYRIIQRRGRRSLFEQLIGERLIVRWLWKPYLLKHPKAYTGVLEQWKMKKKYGGQQP